MLNIALRKVMVRREGIERLSSKHKVKKQEEQDFFLC